MLKILLTKQLSNALYVFRSYEEEDGSEEADLESKGAMICLEQFFSGSSISRAIMNEPSKNSLIYYR